MFDSGTLSIRLISQSVSFVVDDVDDDDDDKTGNLEIKKKK